MQQLAQHVAFAPMFNKARDTINAGLHSTHMQALLIICTSGRHRSVAFALLVQAWASRWSAPPGTGKNTKIF
eukprot:5420815-Amphidinium_carterae.2